MRKALLPLLAALLTGLFAHGQTNTAPVPLPVMPPTPPQLLPDAMQIGHGVNLGNMLEAPHEGDWGVSLHPEYFPAIHQAGFTVVRLPIRWSAHVLPQSPFTIDPVFLRRVDWAVAQARQNDLKIILDYHNDDVLMKDPEANGDRFVATWTQIALHYRDQPAIVLFELLNEPNRKIEVAPWNALLARTLAVVRESNPSRTIIVGSAHWNNIDALSGLVLPEDDRNLLVTFHFYDPMSFTHQGASWVEGADKWLGNKWLGTDADKLPITQAFEKAAAWGAAHHRPLFLGEFGAFSKGDLDSRVRWTDFVSRTAEAHDFPWTYWEFCSGFGVYDPKTHAWRQPLLKALVPQ